MTNLATFNQKASAAWEYARMIYKKMQQKGCRGRNAWGEAMRQAWKLVKALVTGEVTFWKLKTSEKTTRQIEVVGEIWVKDDLVRVWDLGANKWLCFHTFQIW
ncbi:hypothetical protein [Emticicia sp. BO119]|uniref:hypothetical protein n=1 Tax=Emticicia sp. BO119 TaxID=2757768 RepID=UPI0015F094BC|nr:hypothetical protein [Emticicia sp. BO119]MBA4852032.1 hypothetical protein [Emticicia sp. BO119]